MNARAEKDQVLSDYAVFLKALLPQAQGFICHDRKGRVFWSEAPPDGMPAVTHAYRAMLTRTLAGQAPPQDGLRVSLGSNVAYIARLAGSTQETLGALAVLVDRRSADMPWQFVVDLLGPALRSLQRELSLRLRLVEDQRRLQVQATEERLLHKVEKVLNQRQACNAALNQILSLCQNNLGISGAWLVIPGKRITVMCGEGQSRNEAELLCSSLLEEAREPRPDGDTVRHSAELLWVPVHGHNHCVQGIFALTGCAASDFSQRRLIRVARYVGSHIDTVLDRDFDALTGLMAWPIFEREFAACRAACGGDDWVMWLDIDQLHVVNDAFGSEAGDEILIRFATLLQEMLPEHPVSRATGDHFAALLRQSSIETARRMAEDICSRFREHVYVRGDQSHRPSVSIGIGPVTDGSVASSGGLAAAQVACKAAKDRGRARVEVFESGDVSIIRRLDDIQLVGYVRSAIESGKLALLGQRIMPLKAGRVAHYYEVLVRLVDEDGQHVPPAEFISSAERYQLMEDLDRWVVAATLKLLAGPGRNLRAGEARFAINLSGQSLGSDSFLSFVEQELHRSGVAPELIAFEITESVAVARMQQAQAFMHAFKKIGCRFSLDDFGTGLSSFAYLKLFPVDTLKIDGSFIRDLTSNVVSQSVVAAIAEVARVMELETVAEYVQDQAALDLLRNLNISYAQGHLVGHAEPLEDKLGFVNGSIEADVTIPAPSGTGP